MNDPKDDGVAYRQLGFKTVNGGLYTTEWKKNAMADLTVTFDVLKELDGIEWIWIDHRERVMSNYKNDE